MQKYISLNDGNKIPAVGFGISKRCGLCKNGTSAVRLLGIHTYECSSRYAHSTDNDRTCP